MEHSIVLYVCNQTGDFDPVDIRVTIDDDIVVQDDFFVGDGHNLETFRFSLSQGIHQIWARSTAGKAFLDVVFEVEDRRWLALSYWGEGHFQLALYNEQIYFE